VVVLLLLELGAKAGFVLLVESDDFSVVVSLAVSPHPIAAAPINIARDPIAAYAAAVLVIFLITSRYQDRPATYILYIQISPVLVPHITGVSLLI
jgi:hypothetical protein